MGGCGMTRRATSISKPIPTHQMHHPLQPGGLHDAGLSRYHGDDLLHISLTMHSPLPQECRRRLTCSATALQSCQLPNLVLPGLHHRCPQRAGGKLGAYRQQSVIRQLEIVTLPRAAGVRGITIKKQEDVRYCVAHTHSLHPFPPPVPPSSVCLPYGN